MNEFKILGGLSQLCDPEETPTKSLEIGASYWLAAHGVACLVIQDS